MATVTEHRAAEGTADASDLDEPGDGARNEGKSRVSINVNVSSFRTSESTTQAASGTKRWKELLYELSISDLTGKISFVTADRKLFGPPVLDAHGGHGDVYRGYYTPHQDSQLGPTTMVAIKRIKPKIGSFKLERVRSVMIYIQLVVTRWLP